MQNQAVLREYLDDLRASGRATFTSGEAERALDLGHRTFLDAAERLRRRRLLACPRQGFYVVVPQRYAHRGAPPPVWYIDALMQKEDCPYYVGLLKAGEQHGATHQAVMEFQVVAPKRIPEVRAGRSRIAFYYCRDLDAVEEGIEYRYTGEGVMKLSSPELTALDILRYPQGSGGIHNVATVLKDMGERIDREKLARLSGVMRKPIAQRLGYLLESVGYAALTGPLRKALQERPGRLPWVELDRREARDPDFTPQPLERNARWKVVVRRMPEPDW